MTISENKEFCSHEITPDGVRFLRVGKTVYRLACDPTQDHYDQIKTLFRTEEQRALIDKLACLVSPAENIEN